MSGATIIPFTQVWQLGNTVKSVQLGQHPLGNGSTSTLIPSMIK